MDPATRYSLLEIKKTAESIVQYCLSHDQFAVNQAKWILKIIQELEIYENSIQ